MKPTCKINTQNQTTEITPVVDMVKYFASDIQADIDAYEQQASNIILNLSEITSIDSSGIGLIVRLSHKTNKNIAIKNCKPNIQRILSLAGITKLETIKLI